MPEERAPAAGAHMAARLHEQQILHRQHLRADKPGEARHRGEAHRHSSIDRAEAQRYDDHHGQQKPRHRQQNIHQPADDSIRPATEVSGQRTQQQPHQQTDQHRQPRRGQGQCSAVHHPGVEVPTQIVGAEGMGQAGALQGRPRVGLHRTIG